MALNVLDTLKQLVAVPSVNPMGRPASGPAFYETRLTDHLDKLFQSLGLRTRRQQIAPGRANLIARLDGEVPAGAWGPSDLVRRASGHGAGRSHDDRAVDSPWCGRGVCTVAAPATPKAAWRPCWRLIARLAAERPRGMPSIVMACTVDEEYAFSGAAALVSSWTGGSGGLIPRAPTPRWSPSPPAST